MRFDYLIAYLKRILISRCKKNAVYTNSNFKNDFEMITNDRTCVTKVQTIVKKSVQISSAIIKRTF